MHPRKLWLALGVLAVCAANAAVVYKWKDADGTIHYSDHPVPGAERVVTVAPNSSDSPKPAAPRDPAGQPQVRKGVLEYTQFEVTSPAAEQTFFGDEPIGVSLVLAPALRDGQTITWHLNGAELTEVPPNATAFSLSAQSVDRGTYSIAATITDNASGETKSSNSVTFYVKKPSLLAPQHRRQ